MWEWEKTFEKEPVGKSNTIWAGSNEGKKWEVSKRRQTERERLKKEMPVWKSSTLKIDWME